jgi:hypothetical protein
LEKLALLSLLRPSTTAQTPPVTGGCFPDYATFERQTATGFETIHVTELVIGDKVKCLKAPLGPATVAPELGVCRYISFGHDSAEAREFEQIYYEEDGERKMLALSDNHMLWRSQDKTLQGPADANAISVQNSAFDVATSVKAGDVIVVLDRNNVLQYRTVIEHRQEIMNGVRNPYFDDGGLPIVNGVLTTTTASPRGGHWGRYYKQIWEDRTKLQDGKAAHRAFKDHPLMVGESDGQVIVDNEGCFLPRIISDLKKGIDIANYNSFHEFAKVYVAPCAVLAPMQIPV